MDRKHHFSALGRWTVHQLQFDWTLTRRPALLYSTCKNQLCKWMRYRYDTVLACRTFEVVALHSCTAVQLQCIRHQIQRVCTGCAAVTTNITELRASESECRCQRKPLSIQLIITKKCCHKQQLHSGSGLYESEPSLLYQNKNTWKLSIAAPLYKMTVSHKLLHVSCHSVEQVVAAVRHCNLRLTKYYTATWSLT